VRAGMMDRSIIIEQFSESRDAIGGTSAGSWSTFVTVWAGKQDVKGREYFGSDRKNAEIDTIFRIRYVSGITNKMRINYGGNYYDIYSIAEIGRNEGLQINAVAQVS